MHSMEKLHFGVNSFLDTQGW